MNHHATNRALLMGTVGILVVILLTVSMKLSQPTGVSVGHKLTYGVEHVGLTVRDLKETERFFIEALGFTKRGEDPSYPAVFLTDGHVIVTLWQHQASEPVGFNRKNNIGLHHLAFKLTSLDELHAMHQRVKNWPGVRIEFAPELLGDGPTQHMMFYEPGGIRLEFIVRL